MIHISRPVIDDAEINNVIEVLGSGMIASGEWVKRFEGAFSEYIGVEHAVATTSGTVALDIALKALDIKSGDEVIVPDFTFIATSNAVLFNGARPVFADVDERTFNIDPESVLEKITPRTRAVIGVHIFGHPFDVHALRDICEDHGLYLIEDCAQAHGAEYRGKRVGSFGDVSCFSFYATKPMTTGEGGMVITNDREIERRLRLLINHGQPEKYVHEVLGYNYRMTNMQAALGLAQLEKLDRLNEARIKNAEFLSGGISVSGIELPHRDKSVNHVYHQYVIRVEEDAPIPRDMLVEYLRERGIGSAIHYPLAVHEQPLYRTLGYGSQCPVATELSRKVLSLPVHPLLTQTELAHICDTLNDLEG